MASAAPDLGLEVLHDLRGVAFQILVKEWHSFNLEDLQLGIRGNHLQRRP